MSRITSSESSEEITEEVESTALDYLIAQGIINDSQSRHVVGNGILDSISKKYTFYFLVH